MSQSCHKHRHFCATDSPGLDTGRSSSLFGPVARWAFRLCVLSAQFWAGHIPSEYLPSRRIPLLPTSRIRTSNIIERLNRKIRRRTRVVGSFPDRNSVLTRLCAWLHHVLSTQCGNKKSMNMKQLEAALEDAAVAGNFIYARVGQSKCYKPLMLP